jgi:signal transduction histidine kinase/HAMP domain-containing protein
MTLGLRPRIFLTLVPLLLLLAVLGSAGVVLLYQLGNSTGAILRENYDSVIAMERLNEALERIDSAFQFALAGRIDKAREQYAESWPEYDKALRLEQNNITLPGEAELVERLTALSDEYRTRGDAFFAGQEGARQELYFGPGGLLARFADLKEVSRQIIRLNQDNMEQASRQARELAQHSLLWFAAGLVVAIVLALLSTWHVVRTILRPIQAMTRAAQGVSAGQLDQVVPYLSFDELGQLGQAFNVMTHRLRDYRQSQSAQLLRAQRTSQATVDSFPDAVLVIDPEGCVEMANPAARRLLGVVPRQKDQAATLPWQPPESLRQPLAEAIRGQRDYLPDGFDLAVLLGPPGRESALLPRILTIRDPYGGTLGAAVLLQDVTRFRLLDEVKSNLVATASHELKTPLTSVRLVIHLLLEEATGPLTAKQTELLLDARENSERLLEMVNNLLDLARLEEGPKRLHLAPVSPESLIQTAADAAKPRADDKGVEVVLEVSPGLPLVAADAYQLGHALGNLLDNAIAHTERGGRIALAARPEGEAVAITVSDTGTGIPAEYLSHVFEKFFRVPGPSLGHGTGLGLSIVREIVAAHGGTIMCESRPGEGSVFRIILPAASEPEAQARD